MPEDTHFQKLSMLYQENAKVAAIFWEWRNKIITYFSASIAALFTLAGWLHEQHPGRFISAPLFVGAILCLVLRLLDERNGAILKSTYTCGEDIEKELLKTDKGENPISIRGTFTLIGEAHTLSASRMPRRKITYTRTLRWALLLLALAQLTFGALNLIWPKGL